MQKRKEYGIINRLNLKDGLMVKRLRRCPLTAESAVRFRMGLPKKRRQQSLASFFCSPCKERTRQRSCRRSHSRSESCRGIPACGKRQIPQMITNKKHLKSTRQTMFAVVRQFAARQFFTKEHNSSAFLWIIRLTFPKSYYIIEI